jgi:hypothetical protein
VDPLGDCRFHRKGERLTITVPGQGHALDQDGVRHNAPRLLRDVEGDFVAQVRVAGNFEPAVEEGARRAGFILVDGTGLVTAVRYGGNDTPLAGDVIIPPLRVQLLHPKSWVPQYSHAAGPSVDKPAYLRLERRGNLLVMTFSEDGKKWSPWESRPNCKFPRKVKVGVVAEATAPGTFKATFDHFKLTPLGGKTR